MKFAVWFSLIGPAVNFFRGLLAGSGFSFKLLDRRSRDLASVDEEPTCRAFEENAVVAFAGDNHLDVVTAYRLGS